MITKTDSARRDLIVAGLVAGAAFIASAAHIIGVAIEAGNHPAVAVVHALGIDGLIYIGIRAMQRGNKRAGLAAIIYGAGISLLFNAASYGAFAMPKIVIAFTMPVAMLLAFLVVHSGHGPATPDTGTTPDTDTTATRTRVHLDIERESVSTPGHASVSTPVRAAVVQPAVSSPAVVSGQVVRPAPARRAITRTPAARDWDETKARELISAGKLNNAEIGTQVGTSYKTIQRLRAKMATEVDA